MNINERNEKISSVYDDIVKRELDLKPDFQRGEVWQSSKKKLLIDSIIRQWHVPPIHVVLMPDGTAEVLDGQQRLTAIREFIENKFSIDGYIEPKDQQLIELHNKKYKDFDQEQKRSFDRYLLKIYEITNYNQGEPSELFFRLNQTVKLTSSEARNSIYGDVREDIKELVSKMDEYGVTKRVVGFSNSRMAYNDLLSRVCVYLEKGSVRAKVDDSVLNARYREERVFDENILQSVKHGLRFFGEVEKYLIESSMELNLTKASTLSWLIFISRLKLFESNSYYEKHSLIFKAFLYLEQAKFLIKENKRIPSEIISFFGVSERTLKEVIFIYIERCSSRVMSIGSIVIRDLIISIAVQKSGVRSDCDEILNSIILSLDRDMSPKRVIEDAIDYWRAPN